MKKIVVVGGGTMGLDIAHTFARSGHAVVVREISDELAEKSHSRLVAALDKLVARGKMDEAKRAEILGNMTSPLTWPPQLTPTWCWRPSWRTWT